MQRFKYKFQQTLARFCCYMFWICGKRIVVVVVRAEEERRAVGYNGTTTVEKQFQKGQ